MAERMFGIETEYGFCAPNGPEGSVLGPGMLDELMNLAVLRLRHLPGMNSSGLFLQNGARFYVDCGGHPEMATPECTNPWDGVRYVLAGEKILSDLAAELKARSLGSPEILVLKANICYSGNQSTYGCHESYLHHMDPRDLPKQVIPHLVSRIVFTGAGGFNNLSRGIQFLISPRVPHLKNVTSSQSTSDRPIFHTKDEPLSSPGNHRLHILCGESLCSHTATWLKIATTALVVVLAEAGLEPGKAVELESPLAALWTLAEDPSLRAEVSLKGGRRMTAVAIQRHYLSMAEANLARHFMPPWAGEACRRWRAILDDLEGGPGRVYRTLDWAIKRTLFKNFARRKGMEWEEVERWNDVVNRMRCALQETDFRDRPVSVGLVLSEKSPIPAELRRIEPYLKDHGMSWEGLPRFLSLRLELFELDLRFGQLGGRGIFESMDRAGALAHRFPGVDNIEHAVENPPAAGRASLRGRFVKELGGNESCYCEWDGVWDLCANRQVDLSNPFATDAVWKSLPGPEKSEKAECRDPFQLRLEQLLRLRRRARR